MPDNVAISPDGVKISFNVQGEGKPAIVFVHGWSNNKTVWSNQIAHFSKKCKVVSIDLAGFGESGNNRELFSMTSFGEDISAVINKLKLDQVILVGFSMGGPAIIEASKIIPNSITGLVLVDTLQNIEEKYSQETINDIESLYMDLVSNPSIDKAKPYFNNNIALSERYISMIKNEDKTNWLESLNEFFKWYNEYCLESIKDITVPMVAINSDSMPINVDGLRKFVPSFKAKIIPGVQHYVFWEDPKEFNKLLDESIQEFHK